ncbi:hypothetical protein V6679_20000 [Nocardia testacea]
MPLRHGQLDARRAVRLDDRWATARGDLARFWTAEPEAITPAGFTGAGESVAGQALWWRDRAVAGERFALAEIYEQVAEAARAEGGGEYAADIAVVTGASEGSIAASVAAGLLAGGATVVATTSRLDDDRLGFYRDLYRRHARPGAALWVVPANLASCRDVDALIDWIARPQDRARRRCLHRGTGLVGGNDPLVNATVRGRRGCRARYTTPIPPWLRTLSIRYPAKVVPAPSITAPSFAVRKR